MTCSFCQRQFNEERARSGCKGCPSGGGCQNVKCPYCGYEMPRQPRWITWLKRRLAK